jgi:dTDP-4-amino-4,6-dideoxygalactose transaminase
MTFPAQSDSPKHLREEHLRMRVPMLDLSRQYARIRVEVLEAVERVCASSHYIGGEDVATFEGELAAFTGAAAAVGCASGTDALWLALVAAGVQPGDAVVTTPFSFFASASAIVRAGTRPVFADIDPRSWNLDAAALAKKLRAEPVAKLRAVLPVHLYGQCADMDAVGELAAEFKLVVIEDAAQAIGAEWQGRAAGTLSAGALGRAAAFSFYPTKNLSAYGDAGAVTTMDPDWAGHMRRLRNHGSPRRYVHEEFGWNSRLDSLQAAILRVKMRYIVEWNDARRERAAAYDRLLAGAGLISSGERTAGEHAATKAAAPVTLPWRDPRARHVFHQYVVRAQRRDELRAFLAEHGVGSEVYYPIPLHLQSCFEYLGYRSGDIPEAERAAREVLALPMFPELRDDEQAYVVERIAEFYG